VPAPGSSPFGITTGPGGYLWFTESNEDRIGRVTTDGVVREGAQKPGIAPTDITAGPDGNMWFTESDGNAIAAHDLP
jgi:virginiamycin B lyase